MTDAAVIDTSDFPDAFEGRGEAVEDPTPIETLLELLDLDNVAEVLDAELLARIGKRVTDEYTIDINSRREWQEANDEAMDLAMQVMEDKSYPWPKAANVKFPLLTTAAIQFAARAYPAVVPGDQPVKAKVLGKDEGGQKRGKGDRIAGHMSYQLTEEMEEWEEDTDKLLHVLPITGLAYRKTYFSAELGRNKSEFCTAERVVVNDAAKDLDTCPRITHELDPVYPNVYEEKVRQGLWSRIELGVAQKDPEDEQAPHDFLEQHRLLDLDNDGLQEPWIVTVHKQTSKVVRIVANFTQDGIKVDEQGDIVRIERVQYFTKYPFLPNPSGGFHTIGFGYLLRPLSEAINTALNQMLDAGTVANTGGGFIGSDAKIRGGAWRFRPGQWKPVQVSGGTLRENMVPIPFAGPSTVLFQLLGLLIEAAKDITAVKDAMTGDAQGKNQSPTTTLALIEQGMQVFSAIYKRIFRSLKQEYRKLYRLNAQYLEDGVYRTLQDEERAIAREDYNQTDLDVLPVADPSVVTNMQKLGRAQYLAEFKDDPYFNPVEIRRRLIEAANIDDADELLVEELPPDPRMAEAADKMDIAKRQLLLDEIRLEGDLAKIDAEIMKLIAEAEGVEPGQQIQAYSTLMKALNDRAKLAVDQARTGDVERGGVSSVEGQAGNPGVS